MTFFGSIFKRTLSDALPGAKPRRRPMDGVTSVSLSQLLERQREDLNTILTAESVESSDDEGVTSPRAILQPRSRGVVSKHWLRRSQSDLAQRKPATRESESSSSSIKIIGKYRHLRIKCRSSNCNILEGVDMDTMQPIIVKCFRKAGMTLAARLRQSNEVEMLRAVASVPNVMRLIQTLEDEDAHYTVVTGSCGPTVIEMMADSGGRVTEAVLISLVIPLLQSVAGLHAAGVVHRHLKPEHVVCDPSGSTLLIDLTDAAALQAGCLNSRVGTLAYMAPEVLNKPCAEDIFHEVLEKGMAEEDLPQYDEKVDVWSLGVIVYEALTGQQPFMGADVAEMVELQAAKLRRTNPPVEVPSNVCPKAPGTPVPAFIADANLPPAAIAFLSECLREDPAMRPSAAELLFHPWVVSGIGGRSSAASAVQLVAAISNGQISSFTRETLGEDASAALSA